MKHWILVWDYSGKEYSIDIRADTVSRGSDRTVFRDNPVFNARGEQVKSSTVKASIPNNSIISIREVKDEA
jgi:hypothetical protein